MRQSTMDTARFWSVIEAAWPTSEAAVHLRHALLEGNCANDQDIHGELKQLLRTLLTNLVAQLNQLSPDELLSFDRMLERKLYDLDRDEVHEYTGGSDDGFLYARGFIVSMGQAYYEAVLLDPSTVTVDGECEEICYLPVDLYEDKFGEMPASAISRESGSNRLCSGESR